MKAYGIFDGGGVKGAALAGCLAAAQDQGTQFVGSGGASAGSIVALLAAVGYTGRDLQDIMVKQIDFSEMLEDGGRRLEKIKLRAEKVAVDLRYGEEFV
jgi:NTE family protein